MVGPLKTHEAAAADMDGDGDLDILGKSWGSGEQFYWENQQVPNPGSGILVPKLKGKGFRWSPVNRFSLKGLSHTADGRRIPRAAANPPNYRAR